MGVASAPAPGDLTVGGVIAIGGHGTGIPSHRETLPPGHALGTMSNLVTSFKAVVWDETLQLYNVKTFQRSDEDAKAFLVCLGRAFITEVTLLVGLNYNMRCESYTNITKDELFALNPAPGSTALSTMLNETGRVEAIYYPFTTRAWVKKWTVQPIKPLLSREVNQPFNYPFSDNIPTDVSFLVGLIMSGAYGLTPLLGQTLFTATDAGLTTTLSRDLWGKSANLILYVKKTTLQVTANGYAIQTNRLNIQKVVYMFSYFYDYVTAYFKLKGRYPFNGPVEIRITALDEPVIGDAPSLSPIRPMGNHSDYDCAVFLNVLAIPGTPSLNEAMAMIESLLRGEFNGTYADLRPEWSKGWAYTSNSGWSNEEFYREYTPRTFGSTSDSDGWNWAIQTLNKTDPHQVFTSSYSKSLLRET